MMLFLDDIPSLPVSVQTDGERIIDVLMKESYPLNESGAYMLSLVDHHRSFKVIAAEVAERYSIDLSKAESEVLLFFAGLNEHYLVNVKRRNVRLRLSYAWFYMRTLELRQLVLLWERRERYDIPPMAARHPLLMFLYLVFAIPYYYLLALFVMFLLFLQIENFDVMAAGLFTINIFVSIAVHEFAHVFGLYMTGEQDKMLYVGRKNFTIGLYRKTLMEWKEIVVSLLGPLLPALIGLELLYFARLNSSNSLAFIAFIWISNIFTLLSTDGKNIRAALWGILRKKYFKAREGGSR
ncbi:PqqD family protein [Paenibacillus sedimenti]|uniref:PqqD family protein n=1 Tax=Paenibacillus sedimenti TaxID=2770274 RepID=A0A926KP72_9BACL|nr:PqqD family protein [Paenibacillus sedimenti]MBD0379610.1 PqqD family protein [Paenibacillus sedimenti]